MADLRALIAHYENQTPLKSLSLDESKALFDLLLLTVMVDGKVTDDELQRLADESEKFPFASSEEFEELVGAHAHETRNQLDSVVGDNEATEAFIASRTAAITGEDKRREALKMIAVVAYSDGVDQTEEDLCHRIGAHFGFSNEEIEGKLLVGALDLID